MIEQGPVEILEAEHRVILKVVAGLVMLADRLEGGEDVEPATLDKIVEFLRVFADRCHHGKEESLLFPALERRGVPASGCPLGGLTMEHQKGRQMVGEFANAIREYERNEQGARDNVVKALRALGAFYPNHIWKEDYLLFPLAGKLLPPEDQNNLRVQFDAVEHELGHETHERLVHFAEELQDKAATAGCA